MALFSGENRAKVSEDLKKECPLTVHDEQVGKVSLEVIRNGNLNGVYYKDLLKQVAYEERKKNDLSPNLFTFLILLDLDYHIKDMKGTFGIDGWTQSLKFRPLHIVCFQEKALMCALDLRKKDRELHLDATGTPIANPWYLPNEKIITYILSIKGGDGKSPLPVAECITSSYTVGSIVEFLTLVIENMNKISNSKRFLKIETDFSLALIQAACKCSNNMDIYLYISITY